MMEFPADELIQAQANKLGEYRGRFKAQSNYASSIGHPCVRALVFARTSDQAIPPDEAGMASIQEGNDQEAAVIRWIQDLGFSFIRSQEYFSFDAPLIHGKIDGVIIMRRDGHEVGKWPAEIKSIQPEDWERLSTQEDIVRSDKVWHQKWYTQVQLAIHHLKDTRGFGPYGVLILKDKTRKRVKPIPFSYDEAAIERCFEKGGEINGHVAAGTLPERISYAAGACKWCEYRLICNPEEVFMAGRNIEDPDFLEKIREYHRLKPDSDRAGRLWDYIKEILRGVQYATCGEFQIEGKERRGGGWIINITQVFAPNVDELVGSKPVHSANPNETRLEPAPEPAPQQEEPDLFAELGKLIDAAETMDNLAAVRGPAKAARDSGKITPIQADQLSKLYAERVKTLGRKKAA